MVDILCAGFTIIFGLIQGIVVWIFREDSPPKRQEWIDAALHKGGVLLYAWVVMGIVIYEIFLLHLLPWEWHAWLRVLLDVSVKAFLARVLLFDICLNTARSWYDHREGRGWTSPWAVGTSAASDKFVRWLATKIFPTHTSVDPSPVALDKHATSVRFVLWLISCAAAMLLTYL